MNPKIPEFKNAALKFLENPPRFFLPLLLFLLSFALRLALINIGPFHPDSLLLATQAQKTLETGHLQPYLTGYNLPVLFGAFFIWLCKLFGGRDPVWAVNLMSVVFGALTIPVFFSFCRKILDEKTAFFASVTLSALPLFLSLSTFATSQIPAVFFLILGLNFLADYREKQTRISWISAALALGCAGASRPQDLLFMFLPLSYFYFLGGKCCRGIQCRKIFYQQLAVFLGFWGGACLTVVILPYLFLFQNGSLPHWSALKDLYRAYPTPGMDTNIKLLAEGFYFASKTIAEELTPLILFPTLCAFLLLWKKNRQIFIFLILWSLLPLIGYACVLHKINQASRYFLLALPPLLIAANYAFSYLSKTVNKTIPFIIFSFFLILQFFSLSKILPTLTYRHNHALAPEFGLWVAQHTEPNALIVAGDESFVIRDYGHRQIASEDMAALKEKIRQGQPVYINFPYPLPLDSFHQSLLTYLTKTFKVKGLGTCPFEYWQHSTTSLQIHEIILFKLEPREAKP